MHFPERKLNSTLCNYQKYSHLSNRGASSTVLKSNRMPSSRATE